MAKTSPVAASRRYLQHLIAAWESAYPDAPVREQQVVLTVPASFDASGGIDPRGGHHGRPARQSRAVGGTQAAVYAWLADRGDRWRRELKVGDTLLVCDVGGGTTDLTLIGVTEEEGELSLRRIAVGNHILVGGDNMDCRLAHLVTGALSRQGDDARPVAIRFALACLPRGEGIDLRRGGPEKHPGDDPGPRQQIDRRSHLGRSGPQGCQPNYCWKDSFRRLAVSDQPGRRRASGFQRARPAVRIRYGDHAHLAAFLTSHGDVKTGPIRPTHMLFNGGVFKADMLRERLLDVAGGWFGAKAAPKSLEGNRDLDLAVARGAACYGTGQARPRHSHPRRSRPIVLRRHRNGRAGDPRAPCVRSCALCVVPFGMEEGTELDVPGGEIGVVVGEQAFFRFFSSAIRKQQAGRSDRDLEGGRNLGALIRSKRRCRRRRIWKMPTCRFASIRTSPRSACSNSGALARFKTTVGSWNSASATMRTENDHSRN